MNAFTRYIFLCLTAVCLSAPRHAFAQSHYINAEDMPAETDDGGDAAVPEGHSVVVTSIQKCYAQLSHEDVLDIETNYIRPYEECKKRLALKLRKKNQLKAGQQKDAVAKKPKQPAADADAPADDARQADDGNETPAASGGFYRVQKDPLPAGRKPLPDTPDPAPPPPPPPKITTYTFNR